MNVTAERSLLMPSVKAVIRLIGHFENKRIVIAGVAVSLLEKPPLTADVDAP